jgi:hypothetical protein
MKMEWKGILNILSNNQGKVFSGYRHRFYDLKIQVRRKRRYLCFLEPSSAKIMQRFHRGLLPDYTDTMLKGADTLE